MPLKDIQARKAYHNKYYQTHKQEAREYQRSVYSTTKRNAKHLKQAYGMTQADFEILYENQNGRCAICSKIPTGTGLKGLLIDHDHITNTVRGLLCSVCNKALGAFEDDPERLINAAIYLGFRL